MLSAAPTRPKLGQLPFHRRVVQQARVNDVQAARYLDDEVTERSVWRGLGAAVVEDPDPCNRLPPTEAQCARALKVCSLGIACLPACEAPLHGAVGMPDCHVPSARLPLHSAVGTPDCHGLQHARHCVVPASALHVNSAWVRSPWDHHGCGPPGDMSRTPM